MRVCLHAGNTFDEVDRLVETIEAWVRDQVLAPAPVAIAEIEKARL